MRQSKRHQRLQEIKGLLQSQYPTLQLQEDNGEWYIRGPCPVVADEGVIDRFFVEIGIPRDYPQSIPTVRELGGRIPHNADHHVSPGGLLCPLLPDERWRYWPQGADIGAFLKGPLNDYFLGLLYFKKHAVWPFGERAHGRAGIVEYYSEELGTSDLSVIRRCLEYLSKPQPKGHWPCFCGSGKRMRHCHFEKMIELRSKIDPKSAQYSLSYFQNI